MAVVLSLVVAACSATVTPTPTPSTSTTPQPTPSPMAQGAVQSPQIATPEAPSTPSLLQSPQPTGEEAKPLVEQCIGDLAQRLGVERATISVLRVDPIYHGDPLPPTPESEKSRQGRLPTVLTGYYVVLRTPLGDYHYRTTLSQVEFLGQIQPASDSR